MSTEVTTELTREEREQILTRALGLIREPANWVTGHWKCEAYETDENGRLVADADGHAIRAKDKNGRELNQHCIEGAVNQATVEIIGVDRAVLLGAFEGKGDVEARGPGPTKALGLNEIAYELYRNEMQWDVWDPNNTWAMDYNDGGGTHEGVLKILRTGLKRLRGKP